MSGLEASPGENDLEAFQPSYATKPMGSADKLLNRKNQLKLFTSKNAKHLSVPASRMW